MDGRRPWWAPPHSDAYAKAAENRWSENRSERRIQRLINACLQNEMTQNMWGMKNSPRVPHMADKWRWGRRCYDCTGSLFSLLLNKAARGRRSHMGRTWKKRSGMTNVVHETIDTAGEGRNLSLLPWPARPVFGGKLLPGGWRWRESVENNDKDRSSSPRQKLHSPSCAED